MNKTMLTLSLCTIICTGCASLEQVELGQKEQWIARAQKDVLNKNATVIMRNGAGHEGEIFRLDPDSLWLRCDNSPRPIVLQLDKVSSIKPSRNVWAPLLGSIGGLIVGAAAGAAIGASQDVGPAQPLAFGMDVMMEKTAFAASYGLIGAGVGCVSFGVLLGAVTSVTDYQILYTSSHTIPSRTNPGKSGSAGHEQ